MAELLARAQTDPELAAEFRARCLSPRREALATALRAARDRGQLPPETDLDLAVDLLYAPLYYRLLVGHAPIHHDLVETLVDVALHGLARGMA